MIVATVQLREPQKDVQSPSKFVAAASKVDGVKDAFRTYGRFDAVVFVHGDSPDELARALVKLQGLPNVARVETLVGYPQSGPPPARAG